MDEFDRRLLGALIDDAANSYESLGQKVGLSPPAVHARVKKLREAGTITRTTVDVDAAAIGKPFLAFVFVDFVGWGKSKKLMDIERFPEVEEIHSVAGDSGMIVKVRTADAHALEQFLAELYQFNGVQTTKSYIVLSTFLERGTQAEITNNWSVDLLPDDAPSGPGESTT
ncbi:MAG: Lrp/AsnC family transcriptional regulator [Pseudomonadota bacterium]